MMITDKQMCEAYYEATTQELRPQDRRLVRQYTDVLETIVTQEKDKRISELEKIIQWEQNRAGRIGTHGHDCHLWGHQHYECLLREFKELQAAMTIAQDIIDTAPKLQQVEQSPDKCIGCNGRGIVGNIHQTDECPFCSGTGTDHYPVEQSHAQAPDSVRDDALEKCATGFELCFGRSESLDVGYVVDSIRDRKSQAPSQSSDAKEIAIASSCWGCEGKPDSQNNPCEVCGKAMAKEPTNE